jgi:hypothetical protein
MWSSLGPIYGRKTPHAISDFTKNHLDFDRIDEKQLPEFTRAIHYQSLPEVHFIICAIDPMAVV